MSVDAIRDIRHAVDLDAPAERVWRALTQPDEVSAWLGCMGFQAKTGHVFFMQPDEAKRAAGDAEGATHCRILEMSEPRRFVFSWFLPGMPETTVHIELERLDGNRTRLRLEHTGWGQFPADQIRPVRDGLDQGWKSGVLPKLAEAVAL